MHRKVDQYNAMKLNEYNGIFEIVAGNESEDGKFWPVWAIASKYDASVGRGVPAKKDDGSYRNLPVKVILGNKDQAIENLRWLLGQLVGGSMQDSDSGQPDSEPPLSSDVPF